MTDVKTLANKLWSVHPREIQDMGVTREQFYEAEINKLIAAQPRYFTGCLRDGVCRGVCRNTDCPNHDMVVAARVCVEPKQDGVVYTKETS